MNGTRVQSNQGAGLAQSGATVAGMPDQRQQDVAMPISGHFSSSSHRSWNFFWSTSKAATSASAFSFRRSSRCSPSCLTCSSRKAGLDSLHSSAVALQKLYPRPLTDAQATPFPDTKQAVAYPTWRVSGSARANAGQDPTITLVSQQADRIRSCQLRFFGFTCSTIFLTCPLPYSYHRPRPEHCVYLVA